MYSRHGDKPPPNWESVLKNAKMRQPIDKQGVFPLAAAAFFIPFLSQMPR